MPEPEEIKKWAKGIAHIYNERIKAGKLTKEEATAQIRKTYAQADTIIFELVEEHWFGKEETLSPEEKEKVRKAIGWSISTGEYKDIDELIENAKLQYQLLHGGGWYGVKFERLIPYLEKTKSEWKGSIWTKKAKVAVVDTPQILEAAKKEAARREAVKGEETKLYGINFPAFAYLEVRAKNKEAAIEQGRDILRANLRQISSIMDTQKLAHLIEIKEIVK